jgi:aerobic carbon-monoxide dehydrogenase large subunit
MKMSSDHTAHGNHAPAMRVEDPRLVTGRGIYAADWNLPGQLHACFLRSDRAHARIVAVRTERASRLPGVAGVYTGADAVRAGYVRAANLLTFTGKNGMKARVPERPVIAHGKVRFVGEPVALVVAESPFIAQDAVELIEIDYDELPAVVSTEEALGPGAPQLHEDVPGNLVFECEAGDAAAVDAAFAKAARVTRLKLESTRVVPSPMEPRACLVAFDAREQSYAVHVCMQGITTMRKQLSVWSGVPEEKFKVIAHDVGGGFGQRSQAYPEYCALMIAARASGRPVKWVSTRSEGFLSDAHGRSNIAAAELALDAEGRFLALRLEWVSDVGGYLCAAGPGYVRNTTTCMTGVYRIPALYGHFRVALTNTAPVAAYRGAGRPDIAYVIERLVNQVAAETGMDPTEIRRRNFIPPEAFPYKTPTGSTYENADLPGCLEQALVLADWKGFAGRRARSEQAGKLRGIGISTVIENTGMGSFPKDEVELEFDASGDVTVYTVSKSQGQSHETTLAMIVAQALEVPLERVHVRQSLAEKQLIGNHTGGSRTTVGAGSVCHLAAHKLIERGRAAAALELGVEPSQVTYARGEFRSSGDSGRSLALVELARAGTVSVVAEGAFGSTFPNGCHIAEVEIDPETGAAEIASYCAVDDCGNVINHAVVEGQIHGGVTQGAGQVFGEHAVYDRGSGQLVSGSFMDYFMPRAGMLRGMRLEEHPTPSKVSPLGVKGMAESGCTASLPALANAVVDALRPLGIHHLDMPMTPPRLWQAIHAARKGKS